MKWFRYNYRKIAYFITPVRLYCVPGNHGQYLEERKWFGGWTVYSRQLNHRLLKGHDSYILLSMILGRMLGTSCFKDPVFQKLLLHSSSSFFTTSYPDTQLLSSN